MKKQPECDMTLNKIEFLLLRGCARDCSTFKCYCCSAKVISHSRARCSFTKRKEFHSKKSQFRCWCCCSHDKITTFDGILWISKQKESNSLSVALCGSGLLGRIVQDDFTISLAHMALSFNSQLGENLCCVPAYRTVKILNLSYIIPEIMFGKWKHFSASARAREWNELLSKANRQSRAAPDEFSELSSPETFLSFFSRVSSSLEQH